MCLGENALVQLHMLLETKNEGKQDVLSLVDKTASPMGKRALRERLLKPSANPKTIQKNLDEVDLWTRMDIGPFSKRLRGMTDVQRLYRKIQQGSLGATDLIAFDSTFKSIEWIADTLGLEDHKIKLIEIRSAMFRVFDIEKIYQASEDQSLFQATLVPELDGIEEQIKVQNQRLSDFISELSKLSNSQDAFKPEFRENSLVVKGPRGIIQALQASKKLPINSIAKLNKTGSHIESSLLDKIFVILLRLRSNLKRIQAIALIEHGSRMATDLFDSWTQITNWISELDVNSSLALVARENGYVKPTIVESSESSIEIKGLRHPLLEAQDRKIPYVQHNLSIGQDEKGWLLYGLNASGKSSLMRALGLAVLLAQAGSFVPCSHLTLAPFTSLHTRIINTDNLWMGLSSFAVEMSELRDIFREAGPRSLVLGDELCSGTETTSATALVAAGLKGLLKRGARFLFATHLHGLSKIQEVSEDSRLKIWHLHVEYDKLKDKLVYHRTLREGSGSSLYGLEVAKAMRIPDDILENAIRFRKILAGEKELLDSVGSSWNSSIQKIKCEICGKTESSDLEVHHIRERHTANKHDLLNDNSKMNSQANLVVLCDECHDKVHAGSLDIGPMIQTSDGMERSVTKSNTKDQKRSKWSEDEHKLIKEALTKFPKLSMANLSKYLLNQHNIEITGSTLKKMSV
jgi:DNA mismatch repair protein MutS